MGSPSWNSTKLISIARVIFSINLSHGFTLIWIPAKSPWNSTKLLSIASVIFSINLSHGFTLIPHLNLGSPSIFFIHVFIIELQLEPSAARMHPPTARIPAAARMHPPTARIPAAARMHPPTARIPAAGRMHPPTARIPKGKGRALVRPPNHRMPKNVSSTK